METRKNDRYLFLDVVKAFSAFILIFYHWNIMNLGKFTDGVFEPTFEWFLNCVFAVCVPLFFMVNGALLLNREYSVKSIYAKAAKVALLVIVWEFTKYPSWFFKTLLILYLLYPILIKFYNSKNAFLRILPVIIFLIFPFLYNLIMTLFAYFGVSELNLGFYNLNIASLPDKSGFFTLYSIVYFFLGGFMLKKKIPAIVSILLTVVGYAVLMADGLICANCSGAAQDMVNGYFPTVGALIASIGLFNLFRQTERIKGEKARKAIGFLGSKVIGVYLFHMIIIIGAKTYVLGFDSRGALIVLLLTIVTFALCYVIECVLERIPLVKELVKI